MDDRVKHRLIGIATVISLFLLIVPFLLKKAKKPYFNKQSSAAPTFIPKAPARLKLVKKEVVVEKKSLLTESGPKPALSKKKELKISEIAPIPHFNKVPDKIIHSKSKVTKSLNHVKLAASKKTFSVQVATFKHPHYAKKLLNNLTHQGYKAYLVHKKIKGQSFSVVMVGQFSDRDNAILVKKNLFAAVNLEGKVVRDRG